MASTLLLKLIAPDNAPFSQEFQDNNRKILMMHFELLKLGTTAKESLTFVSCALRYLNGFVKAGLIDVDISTEYYLASKAIVTASETIPYKLSQEDANNVKVVLDFWLEVVSQASMNLVREIQHKVTTEGIKGPKKRKPLPRQVVKIRLKKATV